MGKVEVNMKAPDFTLTDFHGKDVSLSDFADKQNVIIVFNRGFM